MEQYRLILASWSLYLNFHWVSGSLDLLYVMMQLSFAIVVINIPKYWPQTKYSCILGNNSLQGGIPTSLGSLNRLATFDIGKTESKSITPFDVKSFIHNEINKVKKFTLIYEYFETRLCSRLL